MTAMDEFRIKSGAELRDGLLRRLERERDEARKSAREFSEQACERSKEVGDLYEENRALSRERDALIASRVKPWRGGGWAVRLGWPSEGDYEGGKWLHADLWHFDDRDKAVAAVRLEAGLGQRGGTTGGGGE